MYKLVELTRRFLTKMELVEVVNDFLNEENNPHLLQAIFRSADPHSIAQSIHTFWTKVSTKMLMIPQFDSQ